MLRYLKVINIENDLGIGNIIFFMPYKRSKTPDNKTFFFPKVTLKTRILPSQPHETPESLMFNCITGLNT